MGAVGIRKVGEKEGGMVEVESGGAGVFSERRLEKCVGFLFRD